MDTRAKQNLSRDVVYDNMVKIRNIIATMSYYNTIIDGSDKCLELLSLHVVCTSHKS